MKKTIALIARIGLRFFIAFAIGLLLFVCLNLLLGFERYAVTSPSMQPKIQAGDLIFVKQVDPATLQIGDIITFYQTNSNVVVTHRIVRMEKESGLLFTKGDGNPGEDGEAVLFENVLGKYIYKLPQLGKLADKSA